MSHLLLFQSVQLCFLFMNLSKYLIMNDDDDDDDDDITYELITIHFIVLCYSSLHCPGVVVQPVIRRFDPLHIWLRPTCYPKSVS